MNVCMISGIFPPDIGGPATYVPWLAEELLRRGHQVQVICLADDPESSAGYPYPVTRLYRQGSLLIRIVKTTHKIYQLSQGADLLYVNGLGLEARLAGYGLHKPIVYKVVGDWAWERAGQRKLCDIGIDEFQHRFCGFKALLLKSIRNYFLKGAHRIIIPSNYLAGLVQSWGIPKHIMQVIPNPAGIPEGLPGQAAGLPRPTLITAARLIKLKGIANLLRALAEVPGPGLLIIGEGPERPQLESLVTDLKLDDRVRFTGQLERAKFLAYLADADALILNSTHEGLPHVVLEAMALGKPVIATRVGGIPELIEDRKNGLLVASGNRSELAGALRQLTADEALRQRLAAGAKMLGLDFSPQMVFEKTLAVLEGAASE